METFKSWVADVTRHYDPSHAVQHFERVEMLALQLAKTESHISAADMDVLRLAAWAHDVCDHKLCPAAEKQAREERMRRVLLYDCNLSPCDVLRVLLIADNISLSKEKVGLLDREELRRHRCDLLRDLVSDADKLDALGRQGLLRLAEHHAASFHRLSDMGATALLLADMRRLAQLHLMHRQAYLRTSAAIERSVELVSEMLDILSNDDSLQAVCAEALAGVASLK